MKRALFSVWDKTGIVDLAKECGRHGLQIISSGGTGTVLSSAGVIYTDVSEYTGSLEMMSGRVKTLHPKIHGGILGVRGRDEQEMEENGIKPIDLLVSNLYPFQEMLKKGLPHEELIEFIDIGGPALIRAAAKNYRSVAVITSPDQYDLVKTALEKSDFSTEELFSLAKIAFSRTAEYDCAISNYLNGIGEEFPSVLSLQFSCGRPLRYGENPHEKAVIYGNNGIAGLFPLQGKEMSYNNYLDLNAAVSLLNEFDQPTAVIVKHNNPCGVASGTQIFEAYVSARETDPVSAYGSVTAFNREVDKKLAEEICSTFVEVVVAPSYTKEALYVMQAKAAMRVLILPEENEEDEIRSINGGILLKRSPPYKEHWKVVSDRDPTHQEMEALTFAWKVCKHTRSNAIIFADSTKCLGIGAGQMSRVDAAKIAISKSLKPLAGSAVASDAFLPFADTLEIAHEAGAVALVEPGGSIRDEEVIREANNKKMALVFTGIRHFRH